MIAKHLIVKDDGSVVKPGIDHEGRALRAHYQSRDVIVVHVSGGLCWSSVGAREYVPARFEVYKITGPGKKATNYIGHIGTQYPVEGVVDFDVQRKKKGR